MQNFLINTLGYNKRARIIFGEMTDLIGNVHSKNTSNKTLTQGLSEFIATMCLMAGTVDISERIYIKLTGDHPDKNMIGSVEGNGNVRGFVGDDFSKNLPTNVGNGSIFGNRGTVTVRRDTGAFNGYTGITEMKYKSIAKNLEYYYMKSEQLPTYVQLFVSKNNLRVVRGVMLQLLPGEPKSIIADFNSMVRQRKDYFFNSNWMISIENLQNDFISGLDYMTTKPLHYHCACTKEMYYGIIFSLSPKEVDDIIHKKQTLYADCSMCGKQYAFDYKDVADLFGIPLQKTHKRGIEVDKSL